MSSADRKEQILDVATKLIAERGYWATSLREVGDACGLTVPGVLHHFASKEALLVEVLDRRDRVDEQALRQTLGLDPTGDGDVQVTLGRLCHEIVARNAGRRELVHLSSVLSAESLDPEHPAHDYFQRRQAWVLLELARLAPSGADGAVVARRILALMEGLQLQWLRDPSRDWVEDWRRVASDVPELRYDGH
jgi:AcrR family transcriptional regulator